MKKKRETVELQNFTRIDEVILALKRNELEAINIRDTHPFGEGSLQRFRKRIKLRQLLNTLRDNQSVTQLHLEACILNERESTQLASALENKTEMELSLSVVRPSSLSDRNAIAISRVLNSLKSLDFNKSVITDLGIQVLAQALSENTTVKKLNLSENTITMYGVTQLATAIRNTSSLIEISLNKNEIRFIAAGELAHALRENTTVTHFYLRGNRILNKGAIEFATMLKQNKTLQTLDLSKNLIEEDGIIAIAQALKTNTTLINLDLSSNQLSDKALEQLSEAMEENTTLMDLRLYDNPPENPNPHWIKIEQSLFRNRVSVPLNQAKELLNAQNDQKDFQKIIELLTESLKMNLRYQNQNPPPARAEAFMRETCMLLIQTYLSDNNLKGLLDYYQHLQHPPTELSTQLAEYIATQDYTSSPIKTQEKWELVLYLLQNTDNTRLKSYALYHLQEAFAGNSNPKGFLTEKESFERMAKAIYADPNTPKKLKRIIERAMSHDDPKKTPAMKELPSFFSKKHGVKSISEQKEKQLSETTPPKKPNQNF